MSDTVRYVSESGELIGEMPLAAEELITCYRAMRRARHFDDRAVTLQRQGRLGVYPLFRGQEAAQVGAALALGPDDWLVPTYRETAAAITHGMPLSTALLYWRAHPAGWSFPEDLRILPFYVPIATQLPHAVGLAHASTLRGEDAVVLAFVGDGGTSEGDAHEALNFASVFSAPVVFVVQNNGWAISVPTERQMRNTRIADRAVGYGMPGVRVDGNDLVAMLQVMREAVARARAGGGPTLVEAVTYRLAPHTTSDDPSRYRAGSTTDERELAEPVSRLRKLLTGMDAWSDDAEEQLLAELKDEFDGAVAEADAAPEPTPESIVAHVFATLGADQESARRVLRGE
ncbi:MAG TPA: pyruvate dehydrogenase (acetyl-transferring) E1 component subunit alpha [Trueperaceae bacterium]|nr:pyruvate dehydrogenase (acetyl-transferring) E1 component subunit alpha [Trueperaceae bacterium]